jgi:hypothetical protein
MSRRIFTLFSVAALVVVIGAQSAQAGRFGPRSCRSPRQKAAVQRHVVKSSNVGLRQVDGRTTWDLGKQTGRWPSLP